ncbi:hypothetical protein WJX77_006269 [Trebouxia sp. C0004]
MTHPSAGEGLPTVLDVSRFAAARRAEIQALCSAIQDPGNSNNFGIDALPRHLRRRATSHNPYKHRRRPNKKLQQLHGPTHQTPAQEEQGQLQTPRPTNRAMRRRPALLQAACEASCCEDFLGSASATLKPRRLETHTWHAKRMQMMHRWGHVLADGAVGKGHGSRALLHALRTSFVMHDSSYSCPMQLTGSKASLLQLLNQISNIEEACECLPPDSWVSGSELSLMLLHPGPKPQRPIAAITLLTLTTTLPNAPDPRATADSQSVDFCTVGQEAIYLHLPNPGQDNSVLGTDSQQQAMQNEAQKVAGAQPELTQLAEDAQHKASDTSASAATQTDFRAGTLELGADLETLRVMVWVHPAAAKEAWATLKEFAAKEDVHCVSRVPDLRRLEVRGPGSDAALASVLALADGDEKKSLAAKVWGHMSRTGGVAAQVLPGGLALGLRVADPRLRPIPTKETSHRALLPPDVRRAATDALFSVQPCPALLQSGRQLWQFQQTPSEHTPAQQIPSENLPAPQVPSEQMPAQESSQESRDLPQPNLTQQQVQSQQTLKSAAAQGNNECCLLPPLPESGISALRQQARLASLHLGEEEGLSFFSGQEEEEEQCVNADEGQVGGAAGKVSAEVIQIPVKLQGKHSGTCPIILVRQGSCRKRPQPCGWSLILPAHWVPPFWLALIYRGGNVAGQREWGWLSQQLGIPNFPQDFPDCPAAADLAQLLAAEQGAAQQKKPKGKRAPAGNSPCLWGLLGRALEDKPHSRATDCSVKQQSLAVAIPKVQVHGDAGDQQTLSRDEVAGHGVQSAGTLTPAGDQLVNSGDQTQDRDGANPHADHADASLGDQQIPVAPMEGFGLLPPGWWVAHSAAAVQQVLNESSTLTSAAARPVAASGGLPQPGLQGHLCTALQGLPQTALDKCLVPVRLQTLGKGVPEAGAAILIPMSQHESSSRQPSHAKENQANATDLSSDQVADKQVMDQRYDDEISGDDVMDITQLVDIDRDHDMSTAELELESQSASKRAKLAAIVVDEGKLQPNMTAQASEMTDVVDNESPAEAAAKAERVDTSMAQVTNDDVHDEGEEQHGKRGCREAVSSTRTVDEQQIVIGVVTTEAPRGVSGGAGPRAVCNLAALKHLYGQQLATRRIKLRDLQVPGPH